MAEKIRRRKKPKEGHKMGGARKTEFMKMIEQSAIEVDEYLASVHDEHADEFENLPSLREMEFCGHWMANGYKTAPAMQKVIPGIEPSSATQHGRKILKKPLVQQYLARQLHNKRVRTGITADWIAQKYKAWATLDITQFIDFEPSQGKKRAAVYIRSQISDLPPLVRQCIKSISVDEKTGRVKVDFIDQKSAVDSLAKLLGFTNDKLLDINNHIEMHFDSQDEEA